MILLINKNAAAGMRLDIPLTVKAIKQPGEMRGGRREVGSGVFFYLWVHKIIYWGYF